MYENVNLFKPDLFITALHSANKPGRYMLNIWLPSSVANNANIYEIYSRLLHWNQLVYLMVYVQKT